MGTIGDGAVDDGTAGGELAAMSIEELADAVARGAAEQAAHLAWWLALIAEFNRRDGHLAFGMHSCAQWLSWRCGIDTRTARDHVRVAGRLAGLPLVRDELASGRLSYSKVRALTRAADADNEALLVSLAGDLSASQLERVVSQYEALHGEGLTNSDDEERRRQCGVVRWVDGAGLVHHEIVSAPEDAGLIDAALSFGADSLHAAEKAAKNAPARAVGADADVVALEKPAGRPSKARRQLDALTWVLRRGLLNATRDDLVDESRYLVVLHVREGQAMVGADGRVDLGNGLAVTPRTLQRLGCGGLVQAMLSGVDGRPLDLGDRVRLATRNQRMALRALYPTCEIPGCDVPFEWCEVHHLVPWEAGGPTDIDNLRPRCRWHHHLVHEGAWREVVGLDGRTALLAPGGREPVVHCPAMTAVPVRRSALVEANRARGVAPPDDLTSLGGYGLGERLSEFGLSMIIDALFAASGSPGQGDLGDLAAARDVHDVLAAGSSPPTG